MILLFYILPDGTTRLRCMAHNTPPFILPKGTKITDAWGNVELELDRDKTVTVQ